MIFAIFCAISSVYFSPLALSGLPGSDAPHVRRIHAGPNFAEASLGRLRMLLCRSPTGAWRRPAQTQTGPESLSGLEVYAPLRVVKTRLQTATFSPLIGGWCRFSEVVKQGTA